MSTWQKLQRDKWAMLCLAFLFMLVTLGVLAPWIAPHDPTEPHIAMKLAAPNLLFPLGADHLGRCIFSRLIYGARITLGVALLTMAFTLTLGMLLGMLSGFARGKIDSIIMRICDVILAFPSEVMLLAVVGLLGTSLENIILASVLTKWAWYAKMIRSSTLSIVRTEYVQFAKVLGARWPQLLQSHFIPAITDELIVFATLDTGWVVLSISTLSFLGVGVQPPTPEWGIMLNEAKNVMAVYPALMLPSGIAIVSVVASLHYLGDSLQDIVNPKHAYASDPS